MTNYGPTPDSPTPDTTRMEHPLRELCAKWLELIKKAKKHKKEQFGDDAAECMKYLMGPYDFMYEKEYHSGDKAGAFKYGGNSEEFDLPQPSFKMTCNVVAEMIQIFGAVLYHKNPDRLATPRKLPDLPQGLLGDPNDPNTQQMEMMLQQELATQKQRDEARAKFIEWYLNYTPTELDLKQHSRLAIDECVAKGMGVMWTEIYKPPGSSIKLVGSFYDTVDYLHIDPDAEHRMDAQWSCRERLRPVWEMERDWGLPTGTLRAHMESYTQQADTNSTDDGDYERKRGTTNDLICYYEIYSKMGIGGRIKDAVPKELREVLEQFGDYCYLVIADGVPYPINLPPQVQAQADMEEVFSRLEWPTPFWLDDSWPWTEFVFHDVPRHLWPMSHLKPALGELQFLNWAYSFIAARVRLSGRDFLAIMDGVGEDLVDTILHGKDMTLLKIKEHFGKSINEIVTFLQHPEMNKDIFAVLEIIQHQFEKRTGLTELIYGFSTKQMRSAQEAQLKGEHLQIRPDDMADKIEEAMTMLSRKEALAARWHLTAQDIAPLMGQAAAMLWEQLVMSTDPYAMTHQLEYRIEAGSTRKPNRDKKVAALEQAMGQMGQFLLQYAQATGYITPLSNLMQDWATNIGLDAERYALPISPPPEQNGPSPEQQQAEMEMQQQQADQEAQAMQMEQQVKMAEVQMDMQAKQMDMAMQSQESQQSLRHNEQLHDQRVRHLEEGNDVKTAIAKEQAKLKAAQQKAQAKQKPKAA